MLWNSKLVIMDEPTAALGVAQTTMVLDLVRRLADRGLGGADRLPQHERRVRRSPTGSRCCYLGRMVAVRPAAEIDRQIVVDLMTTGAIDPDRRWSVVTDDAEVRRAGPAPSEPTGDRRPPRGRRDASRVGRRPGRHRHRLAGRLHAGRTVARIRAGESGVLPVIGGLILISILFQSLNSNFLTAGNLVNLLIQGAPFMLLAMGETFALLLGEIDLSIGFVGRHRRDRSRPSSSRSRPAGRGGRRSSPGSSPVRPIGVLQGTIITRLGLPSFVVTLAGLLGWQGVMLLMLGEGGTVPINDQTINDIASGNLAPAASWIVMLVLVAVFGAMLVAARERADERPASVAPPVSLTLLKIAAALRRRRRPGADLQHRPRHPRSDQACRGSCCSCSPCWRRGPCC